MSVRSLSTGVFAVLLAGVLAGCGGPGTKAGGSAAPVTLRLGTEEPRGRVAGDQIEEFARQVRDLSGGALRIEPVWRAVAEEADDWDQQVARLVVSGQLDLGMIPARAWDTEGVTSLRALHAPFLVTSDELVAQIVEGELADELLAGLEDVGVTGLALIPEGLRHLFAFGDPPTSLAELDGAVIRAPRSETTYALFEALGARPDDLGGPGDPFGAGVRAGSVAAAESSFELAATTLPGRTAAIGNVAFFPKVNSLVVNDDAFARLDDAQREALRTAAVRTRAWAIAATPSHAEAARTYCERGGAIVVVADAEVAAMERAAEPVYEALERDPATERLIAEIRALRERVAPEPAPVEPCGTPAADTSGEASGADSRGAFPEGVYRFRLTAAELERVGMDPLEAPEYSGIHTLTFEGGTLLVEQRGGDRTHAPCRASYAATASRLDIDWESGCSGGMTATWTLEGDLLRLDEIRGKLPGESEILRVVFGTKPLRRIG